MTKRFPERRTALITAGGIAAVIVAGAFAVGANLGILDASSDNEIGALAAGDLVPTTDATPDPALAASATTTTTALRTYLIDVAGTVVVDPTGDTIVVSGVTANPGWTWTAGPSDRSHVELTFTDEVRSLVFTAALGADGSIETSLDETTSAASAAVTTTTAPTTQGDHDDDGEHDGDADHDEEHEGRDDDD
jgi:hypothetical protein